MSATGFLVRNELRRRRSTVVVVALLVGLVTAVVLTSLAGARRSASAPDRFVSLLRPADFFVERSSDEPFAPRAEEVPGVAAAVDMTLMGAYPPDLPEDAFYPMLAPAGPLIPAEYHRPMLLRGRVADPSEPHEVTIGERISARLGLDVGDTMPLVSLAPGEGFEDDPTGPRIDMQVVGITRDLEDATEQHGRPALVILTPAFRDRYLGEIAPIGEVSVVALEPGADTRAVTAALDELGDVRISSDDTDAFLASSLRPAARAASVGLASVALVAAVAGLVIVGQVGARAAQRTIPQGRVLAAIGLSSGSRWTHTVAPSFLGVLIGVPLGAAASVLASPLHPIGQARKVEVDPGVAWDGTVVLVAGTVSLGAFLGLVSWTAFRATRATTRARSAARPSALAGSASAAGLPPTVVTGLSMALRRSGSGGGVPARPATLAVGAGVAGLVAATVFSASLVRLTEDHALYGVPWDALLEGAELADLGPDGATASEAVTGLPGVVDASDAYFQLSLTVDGLPAFGQTLVDPDLNLRHQVLTGRAPDTDTEVALGRRTLEQVGLDVGDEVGIALDGTEEQFQIVGEAMLPSTGDGSPIAEGAVLTQTGLDRLGWRSCTDQDTCYRNVALDLAPDADLDALRAAIPEGAALIVTAPPAEVARVEQVGRLPWFVGALLAVLAVTAIVYTVGSLVRRRRGDLAVLRCLGFTRRQVGLTVTTQVVALAAAGSVIGLLLGLIAGRQLWRLVADAIAVGFAPSVPIVPLVVLLVATGAIAYLAAAPFRRSAARLRPATILRTE